jgi:hypothetical protein
MAESSKNPHVSLGYFGVFGWKTGFKEEYVCLFLISEWQTHLSVTARPHLTLSNHEMVFFS